MKRRLSTASAIALVLVLTVGAGWWIAQRHRSAASMPPTSPACGRTRRAVAGQEFLDEYVEPDGRVVRRDEGGDVVSEGQAYGMLIAVAVGDEARFRSIWEWTKTHLRRADGLLAWRWADDKVADVNSAADADLDAARSLVLAGRRFNAPELTKDGRRLGAAILDNETVAVGTGAAPPSDVNPAGYLGGRIGARAGRRKLGRQDGAVRRQPGVLQSARRRELLRGVGRPAVGGRHPHPAGSGLATDRDRDAAAGLGHRQRSRPCRAHRTRDRWSADTFRARRRAPAGSVRRILRSRGQSPRGCDAPAS